MDNNELLDNLKLIVGDTQARTGEPMNIHTTFRIEAVQTIMYSHLLLRSYNH